MKRNLIARKPESMTQLHRYRIISNIRHLKVSSSSSETPIHFTEDKQVSIQSDTTNKSDAPSHIPDFNPRNELLHQLEEQRLENYLSIPENDLKVYEDETIITDMCSPI